MTMMRIISLLCLAVILICSGCEKNDTSGPPPGEMGTITIELTINDQHKAVPITVYQGDIENNLIDTVDTAFGSTHYFSRQLGDYTVAAEYKVGTKTVIAIDGDDIAWVEESEDDEGNVTEGYVSGASIDVRLKYGTFSNR